MFNFNIQNLLKIKQLPWKNYLPATAFLGGFLWDALTIGRHLQSSDIWLLAGYWLLAALLLLWVSVKMPQIITYHGIGWKEHWKMRLPYFLLQFLFGSLLSALFILYFKSAGHGFAIVWSLLLAGLLVANEFLEDHYQKITLTWAMFSLCTILLCNFLLPVLSHSVLPFWFYLSTFIGVGLTHLLYLASRKQAWILPAWGVAILLMGAYAADIIPPVPLVRVHTLIGTDLVKEGNTYAINTDKFEFWHPTEYFSNEIFLRKGERLYCLSAVFAPTGMHTRLVHRWDYYANGRWNTVSRMPFNIKGGRDGGYRGYSYKDNWSYGKWRIIIETQDGRTISQDEITVSAGEAPLVRKQI